VPHSSAPLSPEEIEKVWPCASACSKMLSPVAAPFVSEPVSQPPIETLMMRTVLSVTALLKSSTSGCVLRLEVVYRVSDFTPPEMPAMSWLSRSHSPSPLVSLLPPSTVTTFIGMLPRPGFWLRNELKSLCTFVMLPSAMMPTGIVAPVAVLPAL